MSHTHWFLRAIESSLKAIAKWAGTRIVAPLVAFAFVIGVAFFAFVSFGHIKGCASLEGPPDTNGQANTVLPSRLDPEGKPIPIGKGDETGQAQAPVVTIQKPSGFGKTSTVKFNRPNGGKPVEVPLPTGVRHEDVGQVVVITPDVTGTKVTDASKVTPEKIESALQNPETDRSLYETLLREKKCLLGELPVLTLDPITITTDKDGRVFVSGHDPVPYLTHLRWCGYTVEVTGKLDTVVAIPEVPTWGPRFRLKAALGYLPALALDKANGYEGIDVGLLVEPFFYQSFNINVALGVRSIGVGIGYDVTRTVTLLGGYAATFPNFEASPHVAVGFALW